MLFTGWGEKGNCERERESAGTEDYTKKYDSESYND